MSKRWFPAFERRQVGLHQYWPLHILFYGLLQQIKSAQGGSSHVDYFRTPIDNLYYKVMSFHIKNANATYQRAMIVIFHYILHGCFENSVNNVLTSSGCPSPYKWSEEDLCSADSITCGWTLEMCLWCLFREICGVHYLLKRNDLDLAKTKAIRNIESPKTCKQLKSFMGRVSYVQRFIPVLAKILELFHKLPKRNIQFKWSKEQQIAFQKAKGVLSSPLAMISPVKGLPLSLHLLLKTNPCALSE